MKTPAPVSQADCICYPGMCPQGCEPACPWCFQPSQAWLEGAAAISLCPRCEGQEHDVGSCGLCKNTGLIDGNGNSYRQAPGFEVTPREFISRYTP